MCAHLGREAGATVVEFDGRDLDPLPAEVMAALHSAAGTSPDENLFERRWDTGQRPSAV
jgi:hypothetical protein